MNIAEHILKRREEFRIANANDGPDDIGKNLRIMQYDKTLPEYDADTHKAVEPQAGALPDDKDRNMQDEAITIFTGPQSTAEERLVYTAIRQIAERIQLAMDADARQYLSVDRWQDAYVDSKGSSWIPQGNTLMAKHDEIRTPIACPMCGTVIGVPNIIFSGQHMPKISKPLDEEFYTRYGYCYHCSLVMDDILSSPLYKDKPIMDVVERFRIKTLIR